MPQENRLAIVAHGFADDYLTPWWQPVRDNFEDLGYDILEVDFDGLGKTVNSPGKYAHEVKDAIETEYDNLCETCEFDEVTVVAHSMGGLTARYCIEELGYGEEVDTLVTFGTPHQGTNVATPFGAMGFDGARDLSPGSDFLEQLNEDGVSEDVEYINIYTANDQAFVNSERAKIPSEKDNVENVKLGECPTEMVAENMKRTTTVWTDIWKDWMRDLQDLAEMGSKAFLQPWTLMKKENQLRSMNPKLVSLRLGQLYHASKIDAEDAMTGHMTMFYNPDTWDEVGSHLEPGAV